MSPPISTCPAATVRLRELLADAHLIGIRSPTILDASTLEAASKAIAIGCFCIGTNQVELDRARDLGIAVFHAPYSNTRSVAELVIAEMVLLESIHPRAAETFRAGGYSRVEEHAGTLAAERLREAVADAHLITIRSRTVLDAGTLEAASKAIAIGCFCIGTNQVDLDRARDLGIAVFHAPYSNTRSGSSRA